MALSRRTGQRFQGSVWPGFVDAMTGLLMVLTFVLTIFMVVQFVLRETISGQEVELDVLASEVEALAIALGLEEREANQLQARLGALNSTLNQAQGDLDQARTIISDLTAERDAQRNEIQAANTRITAFEAQVATLLADQERALGDITALEQERADLRAKTDSLLSEQEALNLALAQSRSEVDAQVEAARLAAARREALEAMVADLEQKGKEQSELTQSLQNELNEEEAARLVEAAAAQALRDKLADADAELTAMTLSLEAQRKDAEETLVLLAAADQAKAALDQALAQALDQIEAAKAQARDRDELAERLTRVLAQMEVTQTDGVNRVTALEAELDRLRTDSATTQADLIDQLTKTRAQAAQARAEFEAEIAALQSSSVQTESQYQERLAQLQSDQAAARRALEAQIAEGETRAIEARQGWQDQLAQAQSETDQLRAELGRATRDLESLRSTIETSSQDQASIEAQLLAALQSLEQAQAASSDRDVLQRRLLAAIAGQEEAGVSAEAQRSLAEERAALLAQARAELADEKAISTEAQKQRALLNQQVAALRTQLGGLQALLDDFKARDTAAQVQLQNLGQNLNAALARAASEERRRRLLEEAERKRLEAEALALEEEAKALAAQTKDLERYRSEFFGRLRDVLGTQEGVRIEGDRFVFSSEVLFPPGGAELSALGEIEMGKIALILRTIARDIPPEINWVIRVDGHTDNVPLSGTGQFADNWELSQARALSVVRYMVSDLGISPSRLSANGFGEFQPINTADTAQARAQNRRIELKLTEK